MNEPTPPKGMSPATARWIERSIIGLCVVSLVMIFQPFDKLLYGVGAGLVVLGGLAFNLVPLCQPGRPLGSLVRAGGIVLAVLAIIVLISLGVAHLYGVYLAQG